MALEEILGTEEARKLYAKNFSIDPSMLYKRKDFVEKAGDLFDMEEYLQILEKTPGHQGALSDLIEMGLKFMPKDKSGEMAGALRSNPYMANVLGNDLYKYAAVDMARFVGNHRKKFLNDLSAKALYSLFTSMPLYDTGKKEHEIIKNLRNKVLSIQQKAQQGQDPSSEVQEEVMDVVKKLPLAQQEFIGKFQHTIIPIISKSVLIALNERFGTLFMSRDGKIDKSALQDYLTANYRVAEDYVNKVPEKERSDYWDKNLKPQYMQIARLRYKDEKSAQKWEDNPEKQQRKQDAEALGLAA